VSIPPGKEALFRVRREDWSKYEVMEGKVTVWLRAVLVKLFEVDTSKLPPGTSVGPEGVFIAVPQFLVTAFFPSDMVSAPPSAPTNPAEFQSGGQELQFQPIDEPWNEYLVMGAKPRVFRAKAVATRIRYFPTHRNVFGEPIVIADNQFVIGPPREAQPHELI
jgi:hypothetical protein